MKRLISSLLVASLFCIVSVGCAEKSATKSETTSTTPGGKTTVTEEKEVKKTGDNKTGDTSGGQTTGGQNTPAQRP
jgi:hypothetical protein